MILSCVEQKFKDDKSLHVMGFSKKIFFWIPSTNVCKRHFMTTALRIQEVRVRFAPSPTGTNLRIS